MLRLPLERGLVRILTGSLNFTCFFWRAINILRFIVTNVDTNVYLCVENRKGRQNLHFSVYQPLRVWCKDCTKL